MEELQGPMLSCELCDYVTPRPDILAKHRSHSLVLREGMAALTAQMTPKPQLTSINRFAKAGAHY